MQRIVSYKRRYTQTKHLKKTLLETYIRTFIPCGFTCCSLNGFELSGNIVIPTHYVLTEFLPLFQTKHTRAIILHSTLRKIEGKSSIEYRKIRESTMHQFLFYNDFFMRTSINERIKHNEEIDTETDVKFNHIELTECQDNLEFLKIKRVLEFYNDHCPNVNFIILTKNNIKRYPMLCPNPEYISDLIVKVEKEKTAYTEYLDNDYLEALRIEGKVYRGILYTSTVNCFSGIVHTEFKGKEIRIRVIGKNNMNRALNMDGVYVEIVEDNKFMIPNEVYGKVVGLYKRDFRPIIGTIDSRTIRGTESQYVIVIPLDRKLPKIRIKTSRVEFLENKRLMVRINEWGLDSNYPFGSYISQIGEVGDEKSEIKSILLSNGIDYENYEDGFGIDSVINNLKVKLIMHENKSNEKIKYNEAENEENKKRIRQDVENNCQMINEGTSTLNINENSIILNDKFEKSDLEYLNQVYHKTVETEKTTRVDFRECCVVSIDPPGCTDIDDAMHCRIIDGLYEVGIHIADVSFFIEKDSLLDKEALKRGTTVYLTDRRLDMIPGFLSSWLCSLVEGEDRFTFSVLLYFDSDYQIVKRKFHKGIIRSRKSFTYEGAQDEINKDSDEFEGLKNLNQIAKHLKKNRVASGSLELSSGELKINSRKNLNDTIKVENIENKVSFDTNSLVEEFMLLANIEVAKMVYSRNKDSALLRRHPKFADDSFDELKEYLSKKNIDLNHLTSKELNDSISKMEEGNFKNVIKKIITRSMNQATYFSSGLHSYDDFLHYGLSVPIYTHFTSPIRRYADLIVHRQLNDIFLNTVSFTCEEIADVCKHINFRNKSAMHANFDCDRLFIYLYLKGKCLEQDAFIVKTGSNFVVLYLPELGIEESVKVDYDFDEESNSFIVGEKRIFKLYDNVRIQVMENDEMFFIERKFDIKIIE